MPAPRNTGAGEVRKETSAPSFRIIEMWRRQEPRVVHITFPMLQIAVWRQILLSWRTKKKLCVGLPWEIQCWVTPHGSPVKAKLFSGLVLINNWKSRVQYFHIQVAQSKVYARGKVDVWMLSARSDPFHSFTKFQQQFQLLSLHMSFLRGWTATLTLKPRLLGTKEMFVEIMHIWMSKWKYRTSGRTSKALRS